MSANIWKAKDLKQTRFLQYNKKNAKEQLKIHIKPSKVKKWHYESKEDKIKNGTGSAHILVD